MEAEAREGQQRRQKILKRLKELKNEPHKIHLKQPPLQILNQLRQPLQLKANLCEVQSPSLRHRPHLFKILMIGMSRS